MANWPGPSGRHDQLAPSAPPEQQNRGSAAQGGYRQPWGNSDSAPQQGPGAPDAYQQPWNQPAPQGTSAQPWARPAPQGASAQPWAQPAPQGASAQPWAQQRGPGGPPPGWAPGPSELGLDGSPPPKSPKRLIITAAVVALVAALAFVGYRVSSGEGIAGFGASATLSPGQTAQQYLEALAAGDAEKALSFGASQPASTELLTNEILAKQNAEMPITNIRILDQDNTGGYTGAATTVHVAVNFGEVVDDVQLRLKKGGDDVWKLENAAVKIDSPPSAATNEALRTVTVFGKTFDKGSLYLFPGYIDVGSTNKYLDVTAEPLLLSGLGAYTSSYLRTQIALNDAGNDALEQAVADQFANCQASTQLNPPGCPTKVSGYDSRGAVDGTVNWGPTDLSGVTFGALNPYDMTVFISGQATTPLSFQTTDGETKSGTVTTYVNAQADMATTPPNLKRN
ncbi:MAG: hypothetical protein K0U84_06575 [Actinomycetia bacterium]|nr:hypothetical protein [Actinomycetes bacterium]